MLAVRWLVADQSANDDTNYFANYYIGSRRLSLPQL